MIKVSWRLILGGSRAKVPLESGSSGKLIDLFFVPLSTFPESLVKNTFITQKGMKGFTTVQTVKVPTWAS